MQYGLRVWTIQEYVFSRRLFYTNNFVSWICFSAVWDETTLIGTNRRFKYSVLPFWRPRNINSVFTEDHKFYFSTQRAYFEVGISANESSQRFEEHKDGKYYAIDLSLFTASGE